jgi:hypothetical protein
MNKDTRKKLVIEALAAADGSFGSTHKLAMTLAELASDGIFTLVHSSNGDLLIDNEDGKITGDRDQPEITCFDIPEYLTCYGMDRMPFEVDILDLGLYFGDGSYEPAIRE